MTNADDHEGVDDMTLVLGSYQNNLCSSMRTTISKEKPHTGAKTPALARMPKLSNLKHSDKY